MPRRRRVAAQSAMPSVVSFARASPCEPRADRCGPERPALPTSTGLRRMAQPPPARSTMTTALASRRWRWCRRLASRAVAQCGGFHRPSTAPRRPGFRPAPL
eukprot:2639667-Prymnesium_polylepis.1